MLKSIITTVILMDLSLKFSALVWVGKIMTPV